MFPRRLFQITGYSNRYIADTISFLPSHDLSIRNDVLKVIRFFLKTIIKSLPICSRQTKGGGVG